MSRRELRELSRLLPATKRALLQLVDRRAESGLESIVRVLVRDLGFAVRPQVPFGGIGRVDLLVERWVIVETDGAEFHDGTVSPRDRRRDAALASRGYTVLRFRYAQVIFHLSSVANAVISAVEVHRRVRNSGHLAARARSRLRRAEMS
jgi:very-short-patch-repair endonuclease